MENIIELKQMTKTEARQNFISKAKIARENLYNLLTAYECIDSDDNEITSDNYPFTYSFDEWICEYDNWIETLETHWFPENRKFYPTLTVGDLKKIIKDMDDSTHVVIRDDKNDWWLNVGSLDVPIEDELFTLTLNPKDNFDTRQF